MDVKAKSKKNFDKRSWRAKKYGNKEKVEGWQNRRKKSIQSKYFRMLKKEGNATNANLTPLGDSQKQRSDSKSSGDTKKRSFKQEREAFEKRKKLAEKRQKSDEKKQKHLERQEAMKRYKEQKAERYKVMCRKNSKGQPLLSSRMEMLLDKIKASEDT